MTKREASANTDKKHKRARFGKKAYRECHVRTGMKGFLLTCFRDREQKCYREMLDLLAEYLPEGAKLLCQRKRPAKEDTDTENPVKNEVEESIEDAFQAELQELKQSESSRESKPLQYQHTSIPCMIFVQLCLPPETPEEKTVSPYDMVSRLFQDQLASQQKRSRSTQRVLPIHIVCHSNLVEIESAVQRLIASELQERLAEANVKDRLPSFAIGVKIRNCDKFDKEEVIDKTATLLQSAAGGPEAIRVDLKNPDILLLIEIFKSVCCLGLVGNVQRFKKYNLDMLLETPQLVSSAAVEEEEGCKVQDCNLKSHD